MAGRETTYWVVGLAALLCGSQISQAQSSSQYPFQDPALSAEVRITDLLSRMTLEEKVFCLGIDPSVPRLGVKGSGHIEGLSGVALGGHGGWAGTINKPVPTTQFPEAKGMGQSWDPDLLRRVAAAEGYEARYAAQNSTYAGMRTPRIVGGLVVRGPNADLSRDPRWGRNGESYGEDPYLVGTMTVAFVKGLQGPDPHYWQAASLMKHFLANSNEDGRFGSSSDFNDRLFHEYYSRPFRMGIQQGGAESMMAAYNAWNHTPMTISPTLRSVVEHNWGLDGIICTDRGALTNLVTRFHDFPSLDQAAAATIHAGINQYLDHWNEPIVAALKNHLITEGDLDENLRGVFRVMIHLGQLDPESMVPYASIGKDAASSREPWDSADHKALDRKITDESIVLLKNDAQTLPLDPRRLKSVAVIGPYADQVLFGFYSGLPPYSVSPFAGIRERLGKDVTVSLATGQDSAAAAELARKADVAIVILGNHSTCNAAPNQIAGHCPPDEGVEGQDRKALDLAQEPLAKEIYAANPHTVLVLISSFPYAINWSQQHLPAIVQLVHSSDEEGHALADVLFGDYNPAGHLTQTWPSSLEQLPQVFDYDITHGETYMYFKSRPLYPFGFGLSYTTFVYSHLKLSSKTVSSGSSLDVSFELKNTGARAGDEVAQIYASFPRSRVARPTEELIGFQRVSLLPGETKTVHVLIAPDDLAYWNDDHKKLELEATKIELKVGSSSANIHLKSTVSVRN
ncbi:glycoside hydrolase family 3 C-terminal domain-containing protein [Granulicella sp. L60]|uniref:glycoside hydrolase family 3 C-terminal domain-containing protein n=1 Tax=Granulicella sp. L60 TaxID=1641866 RepID=UPI00131BBDE1|nr:glycoside hydrolase family 3 C-terminal domain-containing protein [Granulicella sp. L60]